MSKFTGGIAAAFDEMTIGDDASSDPGTNEEADRVSYIPRCAVYPFTVGGCTNVIDDNGRQTRRFLKLCAEWNLLPVEIRRVANDSLCVIDLSSYANSQTHCPG